MSEFLNQWLPIVIVFVFCFFVSKYLSKLKKDK
jgi:hypothetical protein